jgi:hypothetical protein
MTEDDCWVALEYRVSAEFQGFADRRLRWMGCDGLDPETYHLDGPAPSVRGRAWSGPGGQERWTFALLLDPETRSRETIDWPALLPGDDTTGWLTADPDARTLLISPLAAHPD